MKMENRDPIKTISITDLTLWDEAEQDRTLLTLILELTARCNNNCAHCYINLPESDQNAQKKELSFSQITRIIDQAADMGTLWGVLSGGEPLLHPGFFDIYRYMIKKGFLVSIFTNASLITQEHIELFKKYPPRDIEVTLYGVTQNTHKKLTRKNTLEATMNGIDLLFSNNIHTTLKAMITRSNKDEINRIKEYCQSKTSQPFRFDPVLHLRLDKDPQKNRHILSERLSPDEIIELEQNEPLRLQALSRQCKHLGTPKHPEKLFKCKAGQNSCVIDYTGNFKLCSSLAHPGTTFNLKTGSLHHAWYNFAPQIINQTTADQLLIDSCGKCRLNSICSWCPAHADLETGSMQGQTPYFCEIANKRNSIHKFEN